MKIIIRILFITLIVVELLAWRDLVPLPDPTFTWFGLVGTALGAWIILEFSRFPRWLWVVGFGGILLDACSDIFQLYGKWGPTYPWDRLMHVVGGALVALFAAELMERGIRSGFISSRRALLIVFIGAILLTSFAGYVYEAWEYVTDVLYTKTSLALGDGRDTVDDMNLNLLGALLALGARHILIRRQRDAGV